MDILDNLGLNKQLGIVTNQDTLFTGLYTYDSLFEMLFCLCEILNVVKENKFLDNDNKDDSKQITKIID